MENENLQNLPPLLENIIKSGLLLPTQVKTIVKLAEISGTDIEILMIALDLISEKTLQEQLQDMYGVESITDPFLLPDEDAISKIKSKDALKYRCIPQKESGGSLSVLFRPPIESEIIEKLGKKCNCYIAPTIISELRYQYLLNKFYNIPMSDDLAELAFSTLEKGEYFKNVQSEKSNIYDPFTGGVPSLPDDDPLNLASLPFSEDFEHVLDDFTASTGVLIEEQVASFIEMVTETRNESTSHIHTLSGNYEPLTREELPEILSMIQSRNEIPDIFYRFGSRALRNISLFSCVDDFILGWTGAGLGLISFRMEGIIAPATGGTLLSDVLNDRFYIGKADPTFVNKRILSLIGGDIEDTLIGGSVLIKDRPVILCVGILEDESDGPSEIEFLQEICDQLKNVLVRLVRAKKSSS